jgi:hypothetical protein
MAGRDRPSLLKDASLMMDARVKPAHDEMS